MRLTDPTYKAPLKCRIFGHRWTFGGLEIEYIVFKIKIYECSKCGGGRIDFPISGPQFFTPEAVRVYRASGDPTSNIVSLGRSKK